MHKLLFLLFVFILLVHRASAQPLLFDLSWDNTKGKVKSATEVTYQNITDTANETTDDAELRDSTLYVYNKTGNMIEWIDYYPSYHAKGNYYHSLGGIYRTAVYHYDKRKNMVEYDVYDKKDSLDHKTICCYDKHRNRILMRDYGSDGKLMSKTVDTFDNRNNELEEDIYSQGTLLVKKYTYRYDSKGNNIEEVISWPYDSVTKTWNYKYDKKRNKVEADWGDDEKATYKYDRKRNETEEAEYDKDTLSSGKVYKYDKRGNVTEQATYNKDTLYSRSVSIYDRNGILIEDDYCRPDGRLISSLSWKEEYDKTRNWVRRREYRDNKIYEITYRKIVYY